MRQYEIRFAAEHNSRDTFSAVRGHDDEVTLSTITIGAVTG